MRTANIIKGDIVKLKTPYKINDGNEIEEELVGVIVNGQSEGATPRNGDHNNLVFFNTKHEDLVDVAGVPKSFLYVKTKHLKKLTKRDDKNLDLTKVLANRKRTQILNQLDRENSIYQYRDRANRLQLDLDSELESLHSMLSKFSVEAQTILANPVNQDTIKNQLEKLEAMDKVESVSIEDKGLVISTTGLTHYSDNEEVDGIYLGKYKIYIPFLATSYSSLKIINAEKNVLKEYYHPCITRSSNCFGNAFGTEVNRLLTKELDFYLLGMFIIQFLERPNYNGPYISAAFFKASQDNEYEPSNVMDYFNGAHLDNVKFDREVYNEKIKTDNICAEEGTGEDMCGNCGQHVDDCGFCGDCESSGCECSCDDY